MSKSAVNDYKLQFLCTLHQLIVVSLRPSPTWLKMDVQTESRFFARTPHIHRIFKWPATTLQTMPANATAGSTLPDEEIHRIIMEREQECLQLEAMNSTPPPGPYCRLTFDGWSCWPNTPAGATAYVPCPNFITGFDASLRAHKYCELNGTWFRHPESGQVWSNYTTCVNLKDLSVSKLTKIFKVFLINYIILFSKSLWIYKKRSYKNLIK